MFQFLLRRLIVALLVAATVMVLIGEEKNGFIVASRGHFGRPVEASTPDCKAWA